MSIRWQDMKERIVSVLSEFKGQKIGMFGLGIIVFLIIIGILAPLIAPNTNGTGWSPLNSQWKSNPKSAAPRWADFFLPGSRAPHVIDNEVDNVEQRTIGSTTSKTFTYEYENNYDIPVKDIVVYLGGTYEGERSLNLRISVERPDGTTIDEIYKDTSFGSNGTFMIQNGISLIRATSTTQKISKEVIYEFGEEYQDPENIPSKEDVDYSKVLFAKTTEDMMTDPEPLKGTYKIHVNILNSGGGAINLNQDDSRTIFSGRVFGLMGTDDKGRNIARGWVWGARYGLIIGGVMSLVTVVVGTLFGMTSAYYGGWVDEIMQRINEIIIGIPTFALLVLVMHLWLQSLWVFVFVYSALSWRGIAKIIRSRGLQIRQETYVEAAESLGSDSKRIILSHMVPQILPYAVAEAALMVPLVVVIEAGLSVLGLGDPDKVTWGRLLSEAHSGQATIGGQWWWVMLPGVGIILLGFSFIASGMAIEKVINPKMRQR